MSTPPFGRIPYNILTSGLLAQMKPADAKVYVAICAHGDQNYKARPSLNRIAEVAGIARRSVYRCNGVGAV